MSRTFLVFFYRGAAVFSSVSLLSSRVFSSLFCSVGNGFCDRAKGKQLIANFREHWEFLEQSCLASQPDSYFSRLFLQRSDSLFISQLVGQQGFQQSFLQRGKWLLRSSEGEAANCKFSRALGISGAKLSCFTTRFVLFSSFSTDDAILF